MEHMVILPHGDLEAALPYLEAMLEQTEDAAAVVDPQGRVRYASAGFEALAGQSGEALRGSPLGILSPDGQGYLHRVLTEGVRQQGVSLEIGTQQVLANLVPMGARGQVLGALLLVPFRDLGVLRRGLQSLEQRQGPSAVPAQGTKSYTFSDFIGQADNVVLTIQQCQRISHISHPVLLIGETGVGKEIIADAIYHEYSGGRPMPFVKINCSAIPRELLESELFGHEKGAFTGASTLKKGKFEQAAGGVLLLDEIGEMSFELQSKLLRVLEAREFERIGGSRVIPMRARIIASTNQDLKRLVAEGKFRMDLYYRLNTFEINIPPLRAHKSDIPLLIRHFIRLDHLQLSFSQDAKEMLSRYDWPGNVRELRNVLIRLSFLYPGTVIDMPQVYNATGEMFHLVKLPEYRSQSDPLPQPTMDKAGNPLTQEPAPQVAAPQDPTTLPTLEEAEKQLLERALEVTCGNFTDAAARLGISRSTMYTKAKKYGLHPGT
jgi:transcriptional regulator with PAS, ATPase and Fis domain